jgi:hypothetical protein
MNLISLVLTLAILGFALYLITHYIPMDPVIRQIIIVIVVVAVVLWLLAYVGIVPHQLVR